MVEHCNREVQMAEAVTKLIDVHVTLFDSILALCSYVVLHCCFEVELRLGFQHWQQEVSHVDLRLV